MFDRILQPLPSFSVVHFLPLIRMLGPVLTVRLVLRLVVPKQRYCPFQISDLVPVDSLGSTFPNHTSPAIVRPSPLQRDRRR